MDRVALFALFALFALVSLCACGADEPPPAIRTHALGTRAAAKLASTPSTAPTAPTASTGANATPTSQEPAHGDAAAARALQALFDTQRPNGGGGARDTHRDVTQTQGASALGGIRAQGALGYAKGAGGVGLRGASGGAVGRGSGEASYGASYGAASGSGLGNMSAHGASISNSDSDSDSGNGSPPAPGGTFVHAGVNPVVQTSTDRFSTFAVDVDTGSWFYAKRFLESRQRPSPASVRVEELVNALHYSYEAPADDAPFAIHVDAAPSPFARAKGERGRTVVRVALQGKRVRAADRRPAHVVFLVDVSGSMSTPDKLDWVRDGLRTMTRALREDDSIALVTYAGRTEVVLAATRVTEKSAIESAIARLTSGGGTNMGSGLELAYREATKELGNERSATVVVLSDGDANLGATSYQDMLKSIKGYVSEGVTMATVGFGSGNYNDNTMEQLADAGNGRYTYISDRHRLEAFFGREIIEGIEIIAEDTKVQVEFVPERVRSYRLLGYENRDVADKDFRNDKKDAGEIFAGHAVTALYEVELAGEGSADEPVAYVRVRAKPPRHTKAHESERVLRAGDVRTDAKQLDADARAALGMALAAEVLRGSELAKGKTLADAAALLESSATGAHAEERIEAARLFRAAPAQTAPLDADSVGDGRDPQHGTPVVLGALDKEVVRRVVGAHASQVRSCYEKELVRTPAISGRLVMKWIVNGEGKVMQAQTSETQLKNANVEDCVARKIKTWVFPKPKGGGIAIVNFPFRFG